MDCAKTTRRTILICLLLGAVTLLTFWPQTGHDFITYDDTFYLTENTHVQQGLTWANVAWALRTGETGNWHPLTWLSHMLDVQLFGLKSGWHHLTSLLFHAANGVLLFLLLQRMTGAPWRSAFVAALFALHPLHVQSVAWAAERKDVLSGFFFMLTLWAYARYAGKSVISNQLSVISDQSSVASGQAAGDRKQNAESSFTHRGSRITDHASFFYLLSLSFFALGLMSKPMLVTLPFILFLLDYWPLQRCQFGKFQPSSFIPHPLLLEKFPFFALSAASCVVTFVAQTGGGAVVPVAVLAFPQRLANATVAYATYLEKTFWPAHLAVLYPFGEDISTVAVILSGALLLGITAWAVVPPLLNWGGEFSERQISRFEPVNRREETSNIQHPTSNNQGPRFGQSLDVGRSMLDVGCSQSSWAGQGRGGSSTHASCAHPHRVVGWLWFLGMLVPVIGLVQVGMQRMADRYTYLPLIGVFVMVAWAVPVRLSQWRLSRGVLAAAASLVLAACITATSRELSHWQDSEHVFGHALEIAPANYIALDNYGRALLKQHKLVEAIQSFSAAVALRPDLDASRCGLGSAFLEQGKLDEAADQFTRVLELQPDHQVAQIQLGIIRGRQGRLTEAAEAFTRVLRVHPEDAGAHNNLGNVLAQQGKHEEAVRQFEATLRLKPDHAGACNNLAISCRKLGRIGEAIAHYREAIRLQPDSLEALNNLAWLLAAHPDAQFRNGAEAVQLATRACELTKYQNPVTLTTLAAAYAETGQFQTAVSFAGQAQELAKGSQGALAGRLSAMLEVFRAGQPYHEP